MFSDVAAACSSFSDVPDSSLGEMDANTMVMEKRTADAHLQVMVAQSLQQLVILYMTPCLVAEA